MFVKYVFSDLRGDQFTIKKISSTCDVYGAFLEDLHGFTLLRRTVVEAERHLIPKLRVCHSPLEPRIPPSVSRGTHVQCPVSRENSLEFLVVYGLTGVELKRDRRDVWTRWTRALWYTTTKVVDGEYEAEALKLRPRERHAHRLRRCTTKSVAAIMPVIKTYLSKALIFFSTFSSRFLYFSLYGGGLNGK